MTYKLIWNGEIIDEFDDEDEARAMAGEYELAFHSPVQVVEDRDEVRCRDSQGR